MDCSVLEALADDIDLEFELAQLQRCRPPDTCVAPTELHLPRYSPSSSTCDAQSFNQPILPHFVDLSSAPSSSSSPSSPDLSPMSSPPSSPEPHRQQNQLASAESSTTYRVYYFTHMPEKGRTIWVVLFCRRVHSLSGFALRLYTSGPAGARQLAHTLRANTDLSWNTVHTANEDNGEAEDDDDAEGVHQYKVAFDCPNDTFAGRTTWGGGEVVGTIDVGVMKVVSTTSVRKRHYAQLEQLSPSKAHQRLVANFKRHHSGGKGTASRRHHANGKGIRQRSRRGLPFLLDEYRQAVDLSITSATL